MAEVWDFRMNGSEEVQLLDYLGNAADSKGIFTAFNSPEITKEFDNESRLGERGIYQRPLKIEAMQSDMTLKGISELFAEYVASAFASDREISLILSGQAQSRYTSATASMSVTLKGHPATLPTPMFTPGEVSEMSLNLEVTRFAKTVGNFSMLLDVGLNRFEINGVNQW